MPYYIYRIIILRITNLKIKQAIKLKSFSYRTNPKLKDIFQTFTSFNPHIMMVFKSFEIKLSLE